MNRHSDSDDFGHPKHSDSDSDPDDDGLESHSNHGGDDNSSSNESGSTELCDSDFSDVDLESQTVMQSVSSENSPSKKRNSNIDIISKNPKNDHNGDMINKNRILDANQNEQINYDEIKREISDLSVEQCIRKLNEKMSSLNTFK